MEHQWLYLILQNQLIILPASIFYPIMTVMNLIYSVQHTEDYYIELTDSDINLKGQLLS